MPEEVKLSSKKQVFIRKPAFAGAFYESNPDSLRESVNLYIKEAEEIEIPGTVIGFIAPHAGYIYSGPVAGYTYRQLQNKKFKTAFVLAPNHRALYGGVSIIPAGVYRTPLGDVPIDEEIAEKLQKHNPQIFNFFPRAHEFEHSLEVQVPFLQVALGDNWKIVPIVYGSNDFSTCAKVAETIASVYNHEEHIIIASTDMSHRHPYDIATGIDRYTLNLIDTMNLEELVMSLGADKSELCGSGPVQTLLVLTTALQGQAKILKYANSGDTAGGKNDVVGYCSVAFYTDKKLERKEEVSGETIETIETIETVEDTPVSERISFTVTDEQKKMLMKMSRLILDEYIESGKAPELTQFKDPLLEQELGLFVTLRKEPGNALRGCIGHCFPVKKLKEALPELTVSSATQDPRFPPVRKTELRNISIEISLLSPMRKLDDWREIKIPGHGVYVKKGYRAGVFLPQVAEDTGWDRETFMSCLCREKAGLPQGAWMDPDTELFVFTVVKFEEEEVMGI